MEGCGFFSLFDGFRIRESNARSIKNRHFLLVTPHLPVSLIFGEIDSLVELNQGNDIVR